MPRHPGLNINSYELTEDVLRVLQENDAEFDAASTSTASDLPGPGRLLDRSITCAGRLVEGAVSTVARRIGKKSKVRPTATSQRIRYNLDADVVGFLHEHAEFEIASLSTASDRTGPGRTLDKLYGALGGAVENLATISLRSIGLTPDGVILRLVQALLEDYVKSCWCRSQTWRCPACVEFLCVLQNLRLNSTRTLVSLDAMILLSVLAGDASGSRSRMVKTCKSLTRYLK
ncbi:hypothetical protein OE88DRAFT_929467 [Heliocybe sulcata]|uniref:Uncharacterized protein n=1 Tax=Heliocybe sulcata TaxID=5364 RepID=A0A5C3MLN8_9AGAM|nr:hypothetical protein OE88DRAFT_929467 [Heliocybe sulcata]